MRFVDRTEELARLHRLSGPALAVLWGRRRVGKTRLLLEWCRAQGGLYVVADQSSEAVQRRYFAQAVAVRLPGFDEATYGDWRSLLRALSREALRGTWRGPLIIDEVPYLLGASPALASVLQNWIDHEAKEAALVVVLAGSSQRMMQQLVAQAGSPLFGRAAQAFEVPPLGAGYLGEALGLGGARDCVQAHCVWGGIPRYWELAEPFGADVASAVESLVLDPMGPLHSEPDRLLLLEQPSALALRPILDAIGSGAHRMSELAGRMGVPATSLSRPLVRLQELGLIRRELPFAESERSSKRALYRIEDSFSRLWFRAVAPYRALLAQSTRSVREHHWRKHAPALFAESWENLCRAAVPRLQKGALAALGPWGPASRYWRGDGPQWDVVARSVDGRSALLGEAKWHDGAATPEFVARAYQQLVAKGVPDVAELRGVERTVRALFVPELAGRRKRGPQAFTAVDAREVLAALR